jgi:hypothetical protein
MDKLLPDVAEQFLSVLLEDFLVII